MMTHVRSFAAVPLVAIAAFFPRADAHADGAPAPAVSASASDAPPVASTPAAIPAPSIVPSAIGAPAPLVVSPPAPPPAPVASVPPAAVVPPVAPVAPAPAPTGPTIDASVGLLAGATRVLLDGDPSNLAAIGVRGHFRPISTRFALDLSFVHAFKIGHSDTGSHTEVETIALGVGYDLDLRQVSVRPSIRLAFALPRTVVDDPSLEPPISFSSGLAVGAGLAIIVPATGGWYVGVDVSTLRLAESAQADGSSPTLWFHSALIDVGVRFAL